MPTSKLTTAPTLAVVLAFSLVSTIGEVGTQTGKAVFAKAGTYFVGHAAAFPFAGRRVITPAHRHRMPTGGSQRRHRAGEY